MKAQINLRQELGIDATITLRVLASLEEEDQYDLALLIQKPSGQAWVPIEEHDVIDPEQVIKASYWADDAREQIVSSIKSKLET